MTDFEYDFTTEEIATLNHVVDVREKMNFVFGDHLRDILQPREDDVSIEFAHLPDKDLQRELYNYRRGAIKELADLIEPSISTIRMYEQVCRYWPVKRRAKYDYLLFHHYKVVGDNEELAALSNENRWTVDQIRAYKAGEKVWEQHIKAALSDLWKALPVVPLGDQPRIKATIDYLERMLE